MKAQIRRTLTLVPLFIVLCVASVAAQTADTQSLSNVNKQLSNPISSIWALQLQENTYWLNKPDRNSGQSTVSTGAAGWADRRLELNHAAPPAGNEFHAVC
jgi:hypothetical protein